MSEPQVNPCVELNNQREQVRSCGFAARRTWAVILSIKRVDEIDMGEKAQELLNIPDERTANRLFGVHMWPAKFRLRYRRALTPSARTRIAVNRINFFIK